MNKEVFISLKKDFIRVYTGYRCESWITIQSKPVFLLHINAENTEIKKCIIQCFESSRHITQKEEKEEYWLGDDLLKLLKEKTWGASYKTSKCDIIYNPETGFRLYFKSYFKEGRTATGGESVKLEIKDIAGIDVDFIMDKLREGMTK